MPHDDVEELITLSHTINRMFRDCVSAGHHMDMNSMLQLKTLYFVADHKNPSMKDIADHFGITPPSATVIINRLVRNKELKRVTDTHDRRLVRMAITEKGRSNMEKGFASFSKRMHTMFSVLTKQERANLKSILAKLVSNLHVIK
jgi:DNA-binding MarR family transcriptional regulator